MIKYNNEIWVALKENPFYYEISNMGRIRSIGFTNQWGYYKRKSPILLRHHVLANGYISVGISISGKKVMKTIHRLVVSNFIGAIPNGMEVNHKNGDKQDNRVFNLEIVSHSENMKHASQVLGFKPSYNKSHEVLRKPIECIDKNGNVIKEFAGTRIAANYFGVTHAGISIAAQKGSMAFGYKWRYK